MFEKLSIRGEARLFFTKQLKGNLFHNFWGGSNACTLVSHKYDDPGKRTRSYTSVVRGDEKSTRVERF